VSVAVVHVFSTYNQPISVWSKPTSAGNWNKISSRIGVSQVNIFKIYLWQCHFDKPI